MKHERCSVQKKKQINKGVSVGTVGSWRLSEIHTEGVFWLQRILNEGLPFYHNKPPENDVSPAGSWGKDSTVWLITSAECPRRHSAHAHRSSNNSTMSNGALRLASSTASPLSYESNMESSWTSCSNNCWLCSGSKRGKIRTKQRRFQWNDEIQYSLVFCCVLLKPAVGQTTASGQINDFGSQNKLSTVSPLPASPFPHLLFYILSQKLNKFIFLLKILQTTTMWKQCS